MPKDFDDAWRGMLESIGAAEEDAGPMKAAVRARYGEPGRAYHNLNHALRVWQDVVTYAAEAGIWETGAVQMAALLHDVVYDSRRQDNEVQSANFAECWGQKMGIAPTLIDRTAEMILATQHHGPTDLVETGLVLDADLAILASNWEEYQAYRDAIRQEYGWVSDADWAVGRRRVLTDFLERERIYHLPVFQTREAAARENITRELAGLPMLHRE